MKPNTALGLALAGAALLLLARSPVAPWPRRAGRGLALLAALLGALTLGEYFFGWQLGIDELLFRDDPAAVATLIPGRMAPSTAGCFVLLGLAIAGLGWEPRRVFHLAEFLAFLVGIASLGSLAEYFVGQPMLYQFGAYTRMAPHTALGFILLSTGVLLARPTQGVPGLLRAGGAGRGERTAYVVLLLTMLVVLGTGSWFYRAQEEQVLHDIENELLAVAALKADQIVQWHTHSLHEAAILMESPYLAESVARWLTAPQAELAEEINAHLHSLEALAGHNAIVLVDPQGQERLRPAGRLNALDESELQTLALAFRERRPVLGELRSATPDRPAHLDLITPLFRRSGATVQPLGAILMDVEAQQFLYPMLKSWPVPSRSAETMLVRADGNNVLFLNEARHQKDTAFKLRIPRHRREEPTVAAVFYGRQGAFAGFDYRGVKVLSVGRHIPDTPWFLVAKVDEAEAFAGWRDQARLIVALTVVMALALIVAARVNWLQGTRYRKLTRDAAALQKANRAYQVLSEGNQALVRAESEPLLLRTICQLLVERGGYRFVWVGLVEEDEARSVRPVAHAGFEAGYLERLQITWADTERGRGPAGTAARTGQPSVSQDIIQDPRFAPWRADARERGYAAVAGLPLKSGPRAFGVLTIYASDPQAFDQQELQLLTELADNLAFGVTALRQRRERQQAEQRLQLQGAALQAAANAIVITDRAGTIEWVNPAFTTLSGYTAAEAIGRNPRDLVKSDQHDAAFFQHLWTTILAGRVWQGEIVNRRKDGSLYTETQTITPLRDERGEINHFIGIKEDITERKQAEATLTLTHRRVSVLAQLGSKLAEAATTRDAALAIIEAARALIGWDCCWLHYWNEGEQAFENPVNFDLVGGERCEIASSLVYPLKPSPFMRRVMQEGPQLLLRENEDEKAEGLLPFGTRRRSLSLMFAPIRRAGRLQGVISIQSYSRHAYDQAALDLLQTLADHCAGALARIQTGAALAATEERFRLVWENATDGMRLTDAEGRIVAVNGAFCRIIGKPRNEIEGQFLSVLYAEPDCRRILVRHQERFAQHTVPAHLEQHLTLWDGRTRWLEVSNCFIETDSARPLLLGIFRDITERKLAEEALKATERRMSDLINTTDGIVWEADATTFDFTFVSQKAEQLLGYPLKDWLNPGFWLSHLHPDDRARASEYCVSCTRRLEAHSFDYRFIARDGRTVWLHDVVTVVPENGAPRWLRGINVDITERKLVEARLREQAEVMDKAPVAIIITDLSHRVTYCNEGARRLYGFTEAQMLGHTADELFTAETMLVLGAGRTATLATGSWRGEVPTETRDGHRVTAEFIMSLIRDGDGRPVARLSIAVDITEKIQMAEQVKRMQRLESLGMLAAGIAHDMNNILAPILMAVPLLKTRVNDDRSQGMLTTLQKSGERGAALVRQLLSFAHGASGELKLLQARHVLKDIAEMVTASFPKTIRLAAELPGDLWPVIGNASQLHQVFLNLCINARDAMPDGGTLHLGAANRRLTPEAAGALPNARPGAFLAVTVADTGTGIPPEILERIWEPFFTTKTPDKGTGLGLSTVRGIVAQHQGFIDLQTHAGQGTTFTVYLPADQASVRGESRPVSATPLPHGAGELVLVVDDEPPVRELVAGTLEHFGYRVLSAGDGAEAIASFATHAEEVRLVVTDLQMPLLDGKNLVTALLRIRPGLPIICMSGADTVSKSMIPFISAFLTKPFTVEALVETTHTALHRSSGGAG